MVHLCAWLCQYKGLDCKKDIITHTDVVGKNYKLCPIYMVKNPSKMDQFKLDCYNLKAEKIAVKDIKNCTNGKGEVTKVPGTSSTSSDKKMVYRVIAGSYYKKETAETEAKELKEKGYNAFVAPYEL